MLSPWTRRHRVKASASHSPAGDIRRLLVCGSTVMKPSTLHRAPFKGSVVGRGSATRVVCQAQQVAVSSSANVIAPPAQRNQLLAGAVEALFKFPPFFDMAASKARRMIVERGERIGVDWQGTIAQLKQQHWDAALAEVLDPAVVTPPYYQQPFHAYKQGNLCWEAALEVTLAAKSVHAPVMDPTNKVMDPEGDMQLRSSYGACMLRLMQQLGVTRPMREVLDVGAATGLSSLALREVLPQASVEAIDLSPHFLAVGRYEQQQREARTGQREPITFMHAAAEATGLPDASYDMVSICLVLHELPQHATCAILAEAYRLLRPGGVLSIMEMNPASPAFQRVLNNVFAYTAFKSTEPWLQEYISLDLHGAILKAGFSAPVLQAENSPRHRTVVALKC